MKKAFGDNRLHAWILEAEYASEGESKWVLEWFASSSPSCS
jgi:hypothetical protein